MLSLSTSTVIFSFFYLLRWLSTGGQSQLNCLHFSCLQGELLFLALRCLGDYGCPSCTWMSWLLCLSSGRLVNSVRLLCLLGRSGATRRKGLPRQQLILCAQYVPQPRICVPFTSSTLFPCGLAESCASSARCRQRLCPGSTAHIAARVPASTFLFVTVPLKATATGVPDSGIIYKLRDTCNRPNKLGAIQAT